MLVPNFRSHETMYPKALIARCARVMFLLIFCVLTATAPPALAQPARQVPSGAVCSNTEKVQLLARISNTRDSDVQCLGVKLDGNAIEALRVETHRLVTASDATISDHVKVKDFPVAQIESQQGAVLDGAQGHKAVILQGHASPSGGNVELVTSYLYNGLTGEYRSCRVTLDHSGDAAWHLVNQYNETVSRIVIRTRSVPLLGTIGIANLDGACTRT
jgi:hypothetical protein